MKAMKLKSNKRVMKNLPPEWVLKDRKDIESKLRTIPPLYREVQLQI